MKPVRKANKEGEEEKAEETVMEDDSNSNGNDPNPKFVKITHNSKPAFKCTATACGHIKTKKDETLKHLKLHEEGSDAVKCGICGWIIVKGKLKWHTRHYHGRKKLVKRAKPVEKGRAHFRCELCGFFSTMLLTVRDHLETHERRDGTLCAECGWWCYDISFHRAYWHPEKGSWAEKRLQN
ncbi:unnamed protein product [Orchesella dallaii]|uniref:C2H2-type domain-containing protein n=1 Tax=Orchesella dallaii TaxID=48710 RepID=A0ABP1RU63_9HEXA